MARNIGGNVLISKQTSINFTVRNTALDRRTIKIFNTKVLYGQTLDLMTISDVSEADIRQSLITGELAVKLRASQINIVSSSINLTQVDESQRSFLQDAGIEATSARFYETHLEADVSILNVTSPPPAPYELTPFQPLLTLSEVELRAGKILIDATFSLSITRTTPEETAPLAQLKLFVDGVEVPFSACTLTIAGLSEDIEAINMSGAIRRMATVTAGVHTIDLMWAASGADSATQLNCSAASDYDHASLTVMEV